DHANTRPEPSITTMESAAIIASRICDNPRAVQITAVFAHAARPASRASGNLHQEGGARRSASTAGVFISALTILRNRLRGPTIRLRANITENSQEPMHRCADSRRSE